MGWRGGGESCCGEREGEEKQRRGAPQSDQAGEAVRKKKRGSELSQLPKLHWGGHIQNHHLLCCVGDGWMDGFSAAAAAAPLPPCFASPDASPPGVGEWMTSSFSWT